MTITTGMILERKDGGKLATHCRVCKKLLCKKKSRITDLCRVHIGGLYRKEKITLKCGQCSKTVVRRPSEHNKGGNNFCGYKCLGKWQSENMTGKNAYWYGKGQSKEELKKKLKARDLLNKKINSGEVKKLKCLICKSPETQGHHSDYNKPYKVIWLCFKHHTKAHRIKTVLLGESPKERSNLIKSISSF